ncbi:hypothetical protein SUGI_0054920 [Cryptomeria japonica]|uniref:pentatricopeptide repeat-containing protein DOT4, chloroplastic n=1 Tax=Cryptomeria japonica TaxID=3369 RepID=UPI002408A075|nr:pentatricopeptide repeat-containing protein DOT4, chloroplastic [Cryptomeria japonica]GLJ06991.1 hypothetical protein SUGI_0054920 [Cryptomeria japonica]
MALQCQCIFTIHNNSIIEGERKSSRGKEKRCAIPADISILCREGRLKDALSILHRMQDRGIPLHSNVYVQLAEECAFRNALSMGKQLHASIPTATLRHDRRLNAKLLSMYLSCSSMSDARQLFDKIPSPNTYLYTEMIKGYGKNGLYQEALDLHDQMKWAGVESDSFTYPLLLNACTALSNLQRGKQIHDCISRDGLDTNDYVASSLINMYIQCGRIDIARQVFGKISRKNVASWNAMIAGCAKNRHTNESLRIFGRMVLDGVKPNLVTILSILPACTQLEAIQQGKQIHKYVLKAGFESNLSVGNALIFLYAKCKRMDVARHVFERMVDKDVISWTSMISGYAQSKDATQAFQLFSQMHLAGAKLDVLTILSIIAACTNISLLPKGKEIHAHAIRSGFVFDVLVANALIGMYAKCCAIHIARKVFDKMPYRNVVSWTAMVAGYVKNRYDNEALNLFRKIKLKVDPVTIASVLPAAAHLASLENGKELHGYAIKNGFESDIFVGSALIDMYAKCGSIELSRQVFDRISPKNVVSWNAMITGYGLHGMGMEMLDLFVEMDRIGMQPTYVTFVSVLSACSHTGLMDQGWKYFNAMTKDYGITPRMEHYACMVDLLSRAGHLDEALDFIQKMPMEPDATVWGALLAACRVYCNVELAEHAAERLLYLEPENPANRILLSNIYAASGRWEDVARVRAGMKDMRLKKTPGCSWISVKSRIHTFLVNDRSHPQSENIHETLEVLKWLMQDAGYDESLAQYTMDEE